MKSAILLEFSYDISSSCKIGSTETTIEKCFKYQVVSARFPTQAARRNTWSGLLLKLTIITAGASRAPTERHSSALTKGYLLELTDQFRRTMAAGLFRDAPQL